MDIITELTGMLNMPLLILGLLIGFVVKHLVSDATIQNKYIPPHPFPHSSLLPSRHQLGYKYSND